MRKSTAAHWQLPAGLDYAVLRTITVPRVSGIVICIRTEFRGTVW